MALIKCPKCGEEIPDTSRSCSKCGFEGIASYLLEEDKKQKESEKKDTSAGKVSIKVWLILLVSIICLGVGIVLLGQYNTIFSGIKSTVMNEYEKTNDSIVDYRYKPKSGEYKSVSVYMLSDYERDYTIKKIVSDLKGEQWITYHRTCGKLLIFVGVVFCLIFVNKMLIAIKGEIYAKLLKWSAIGVTIGVLLCLLGGFIISTDGDVLGEISFLFFGVGIAGLSLYGGSKAISRYNLRVNDPEAYRKLVKQEELQAAEEAENRKRQLDAERDAAINGTGGAPWETHYLPYPCPHCGRYKVRYIKWEDKKASIYFWGRMSTKIGKNYICDNCKKTWE